MHESWKHETKWKKSVTKDHPVVWFPDIEMSQTDKNLETKNKLVVASG